MFGLHSCISFGRIGITLSLLLGLVVLSACSATPTRPASEAGVEFAYSIQDVHAAALSALSEHGFEVVTNQETYIEGKRPHKVGLVVGSGGETIGVWLSGKDDKTTQVTVDTAKSFAGMAGQKNWDDEVLSSIRSALEGSRS